uniref:CCHC-type domain-containing protein n=1 Tax=Anopheles culicifacies TaxID=139723 RepID=A0A182LY76_9DIPT
MGLGNSKQQEQATHPKHIKRGPQASVQNNRMKSDHRQTNGLSQQRPQWKQPANSQLQKHSQPPRQQQKVLVERNRTNKVECNVCGHEGHTGARCYHRHQTCMICLQPGHLRSVCKQKTHHPDSIYKPKDGTNKPVDIALASKWIAS